jgi:hypothetical protein
MYTGVQAWQYGPAGYAAGGLLVAVGGTIMVIGIARYC